MYLLSSSLLNLFSARVSPFSHWTLTRWDNPMEFVKISTMRPGMIKPSFLFSSLSITFQFRTNRPITYIWLAAQCPVVIKELNESIMRYKNLWSKRRLIKLMIGLRLGWECSCPNWWNFALLWQNNRSTVRWRDIIAIFQLGIYISAFHMVKMQISITSMLYIEWVWWMRVDICALLSNRVISMASTRGH